MKASEVYNTIVSVVEALMPTSQESLSDAYHHGDPEQDATPQDRTIFLRPLNLPRKAGRLLQGADPYVLALELRMMYNRDLSAHTRMLDDAEQVMATIYGLKSSNAQIVLTEVQYGGVQYNDETMEVVIHLSVEYDPRDP